MRAFTDCLRRYSKLVGQALDLMESGFESELQVLRRQCRVAWGEAEEARIALYRHEANHHCGFINRASH